MSYEEKRVRVAAYGTVPKGSPLLVRVPGVGGKPRLLHTLAARALTELATAVREDLGLELRLASGWRPHRWSSREHYERVLVQRFGSVREGRKWLAFDSPHETGLAIDIGMGGLTPSRSTRDEQRKTKLHQWLVKQAYRFGWHPYKLEPWHWEHAVSKLAWQTGEPDPEGTAALLAADRGDESSKRTHLDGEDPELCEVDIEEPELEEG